MRILIGSLLLMLLCSCSGGGSKEFTQVDIQPVFEDSLSIRAIAPLDADRVWFAANRGRVGLIDQGIPKLATIKYQDSLLSFRSIAATSEAVFVLSIANPGVLYKIGFDGKEATNIQEVYTEKGEKVFYDAMAFWDDQDGIAMGDPTEDCLSVIITNDGGNQWEKVSCDLLPPSMEGEAAFAASTPFRESSITIQLAGVFFNNLAVCKKISGWGLECSNSPPLTCTGK